MRFTFKEIKQVADGAKSLNHSQTRQLAQQIISGNLDGVFDEEDIKFLISVSSYFGFEYRRELESLISKIQGAINLHSKKKLEDLPVRRIK